MGLCSFLEEHGCLANNSSTLKWIHFCLATKDASQFMSCTLKEPQINWAASSLGVITDALVGCWDESEVVWRPHWKHSHLLLTRRDLWKETNSKKKKNVIINYNEEWNPQGPLLNLLCFLLIPLKYTLHRCDQRKEVSKSVWQFIQICHRWCDDLRWARPAWSLTYQVKKWRSGSQGAQWFLGPLCLELCHAVGGAPPAPDYHSGWCTGPQGTNETCHNKGNDVRVTMAHWWRSRGRAECHDRRMSGSMGEIREEGNRKMSVTKNGDGESRNKGSLNRDEAQTVRRCGRKTGRRNQRSEHMIHPVLLYWSEEQPC